MMIEIEKDKLYSRKECVNLIRDHRGEPAQGAYFNVWNKSKTNVLSKAIFINKESIYDDQVLGYRSIQWNDSIGKKAQPGLAFLAGGESTFIFHEGNNKPKRYYFVGEVESFERTGLGAKDLGVPSKFKLTLKVNMSQEAYNSFSDPVYIEKNREIRETALNNAYGAIDPVKADLIGKAGERIFDETVREKKYFYSDIKDFIEESEVKDYLWLNKSKESYKPYDFIINERYYDVKATITNNEKFFVSAAELKLIKKQQLNIVLIWLDENYKFKNKKIINAKDVLEHYKFTGKNYLATKR